MTDLLIQCSKLEGIVLKQKHSKVGMLFDAASACYISHIKNQQVVRSISPFCLDGLAFYLKYDDTKHSAREIGVCPRM